MSALPMDCGDLVTPATDDLASWWKTGVIYHVYPRSYADADGDGVGDLRGLIDRLDYLNDGTPRSLGVSAIWLSPIYLSPGRDVGYDVADHTMIDPTFGSMEDFDVLVRETRRRGMHIVLDLVLNHTSDLHPWFLESRASRDNPKRDWYVWSRPGPGRRPPNNWRSFFGGPAWRYDDHSEQHYLHTFLPEQPDLNWHNPEVRAAALDIVRFWLDRGVSGFRLDVFNAYFKHPELLSNPRRLGRTPWARQRHIYNKDRPELHDFLIELRQLLDARDAMAVGETFEGGPEVAASYCDKLHMAFNFDFLAQPWEPKAIQASIGRWDRLLAHEHMWPSWVLSNHDNPRHAWRYGRDLTPQEADARAKVAAAMLLTLRGTPFIYYGEEIGLRDVEVPSIDRWDVAFKRASRDAARTPMHWNGGEAAGFTTGRPWLPIGEDFRERNVDRQSSDNRSILSFYRQLIWLRRSSRALQVGRWAPLVRAPRSTLAYLRTSGQDAVLVALNFTSRPATVRFDEALPTRRWTLRATTRRPDLGWTVVLGRQLELGPYEATVFQAEIESGADGP
jgi:alpha-glucosidase